MTTFSDEDYRYPIAEMKLGKPESDDWKLFSASEEINVYALLDQETGYFQWKVRCFSPILRVTLIQKNIG